MADFGTAFGSAVGQDNRPGDDLGRGSTRHSVGNCPVRWTAPKTSAPATFLADRHNTTVGHSRGGDREVRRRIEHGRASGDLAVLSLFHLVQLDQQTEDGLHEVGVDVERLRVLARPFHHAGLL